MPEGALKKPTSEVGSLNLKNINMMAIGYSFSAFLWPLNPVFGPLDKLAEVVATESRKIDVLTKEFRELSNRLDMETAYWTSFRCSAETDKMEKRDELEDCVALMTDVKKGAHEACVCIVSNEPILKLKLTGNVDSRDMLGQRIAKLIEQDTDDNGTNWLLGGTIAGSGVGSKVSVAADENGVLKTTVRLESFGAEGAYYKSIDVPDNTELDKCGLPEESTPGESGRIIYTKYDIQTKLLSFTLISKIETDAPGTRYEFVMERGFVPNGSPDLTRFKGDLLKKNCAGQIIGFGSAKFDGLWTY